MAVSLLNKRNKNVMGLFAFSLLSLGNAYRGNNIRGTASYKSTVDVISDEAVRLYDLAKKSI
jgi:hypothetical protein